MFKKLLLSLVLFALPVSASDLVPIEQYSKLPSASQVEISPNGDRYAYLAPVNGVYNLVFHSFSDKKIKGIIPTFKKATISWFKWVNDDYLVISYAYTQRSRGRVIKRTLLNSFNVKTKVFKKMFQAGKNQNDRWRGNIQDKVLSFMPNDPNFILMELDLNGYRDVEIYKVNITTGSYKQHHAAMANITSYKVDRQLNARLASGYNKGQRIHKYLNPETNKWEDITAKNWARKGYKFLDFYDNPRFAYLRKPNDKGVYGVVKYDLVADKDVELIFQDQKYDARKLKYDQRQNVLGVLYTHHHSEAYYMDPFYQGLQKSLVKAFGSKQVYIIQYNEKSNIAILWSANKNNSGAYYTLDLNKNKVTPFAYRNTPIVDKAYSQPVPVQIPMRDKAMIDAYLTLPKGLAAQNLPTVIMPHGGPKSRTTQNYYYMAQMLANRGYAVLQPNYRGSTGYGRNFENHHFKQWGGVMQRDVTDATKWMISVGIANPKEICIMGTGYGGYSTLMGTIQSPDLYRCAISLNGIFDIPAYKSDRKIFIGNKYWGKSIGLRDTEDKAVSPYYQTDKISAAVLLAHARDDINVNYQQSKDMHAKLKKHTQSKYLELKHGRRQLENEKSRLIYLKSVEAFLKKHMPSDKLK